MIEKLYSLKEVAKLLRVSERTIFRYINGENTEARKLKATKIGYWRISESDLKSFLQSNANVAIENIGTNFSKAVIKKRKNKKRI